MKIGISIITSDNRRVETIALIDSGAKGASFISQNFAENSKIPLLSLSKKIPVLNVDGTENQGGSIREYAEVTLKVQGRTCNVCLLATSLGRETVILGFPWLRQENPDIDWRKQTLTWREFEPYRIKTIGFSSFEHVHDDSLVISAITGKLTDEAREAWMKTRMSHSQLFALEEEKAKPKKTTKEIVPVEFHKYLDTVFSEREVGRLPPRTKYDHAIDLKPGFEPRRGAIFQTGPQHN